MMHPPGPIAELRSWIPRWWEGEGGSIGSAATFLTAPFETVFRGVVRARNGLYDRGILRTYRGPVPVVSVGNLSVGGTGKTPFCAWIAARLAEMECAPAVVLRGYGSDEIEVHREINSGIPVFAARQRLDAVREAAAAGAGCVVLDDGFQHRRLFRDLDIVLIAAETWRERRRMLPRGGWREPVDGLRRAGFVVVTRKVAGAEVAAAVRADLSRQGVEVPIGIAHLKWTGVAPLDGAGLPLPLAHLEACPVVAITTLANPKPFLVALERGGARVESIAFPDHHDFSEADVAVIRKRCEGRTAVMTRKEAVKLRSRLPAGVPALVIEQAVEMEAGWPALGEALHRAIGGGG